METSVYTNSSVSMDLPKLKGTCGSRRKTMSEPPIPDGYMSLEQFEKELVEAVAKKL